MKKTLTALAMTAGLLACESPEKMGAKGEHIIIVPQECVSDLKYSHESHTSFQLNCTSADGTPLFFQAYGKNWERHSFEYPNGEKVQYNQSRSAPIATGEVPYDMSSPAEKSSPSDKKGE